MVRPSGAPQFRALNGKKSWKEQSIVQEPKFSAARPVSSGSSSESGVSQPGPPGDATVEATIMSFANWGARKLSASK